MLVVDDDESIREFVTWALEDEGHEVLAAANGAAALRILDGAAADVILLDMRMPVMDGWQFIKAYRQSARKAVPIIVLTAARDAAERAGEVAADGHLAKPFRLDELIATVNSVTVAQ